MDSVALIDSDDDGPVAPQPLVSTQSMSSSTGGGWASSSGGGWDGGGWDGGYDADADGISGRQKSAASYRGKHVGSAFAMSKLYYGVQGKMTKPGGLQKKLCKYHLKYNRCEKGDKCEYAHSIQEIKEMKRVAGVETGDTLVVTPDGLKMKKSSDQERKEEDRKRKLAYKKAQLPAGRYKLCKFFMAGKTCLFGEFCRDAHGEEQLVPGSESNERPPPLITKYKLCVDFITKGQCNYGERCYNAHTPEELVDIHVPEREVDGHVKRAFTIRGYKQRLCMRHLMGGCFHGATCRLAHGKEELREDPNPPPHKRRRHHYDQEGNRDWDRDWNGADQGKSEASDSEATGGAASARGGNAPEGGSSADADRRAEKTDEGEENTQGSRSNAGGDTDPQRPSLVPPPPPPPPKRIVKIRMCDFFLSKGECIHGDKCNFAHSIEECREARQKHREEKEQRYESKGNGKGKDKGKGKSQKYIMCRLIQEGKKCDYGDRCKFAHTEEELREGRKAAQFDTGYREAILQPPTRHMQQQGWGNHPPPGTMPGAWHGDTVDILSDDDSYSSYSSYSPSAYSICSDDEDLLDWSVQTVGVRKAGGPVKVQPGSSWE